MCHTVGSKVLPTIETKFEWGAPFPEPYTELISTMSCLSADGVGSGKHHASSLHGLSVLVNESTQYADRKGVWRPITQCHTM